MSSILALDQGTTGSTAVVVGDDGAVLGKGYYEFPQHFPKPGWVEHDPEDIWSTMLAAARDALGGERPTAIGITNQRETVVVWDRATTRPLHNALVWQDRRTSARCRELQSELGDAFIADRTGLVWDPYFSATKIAWLLDHVPDLRAAAENGEAVFGTVDAWLLARLTGGRAIATDYTNASRTLLFNIHDEEWDDDLLELFDVPRVALPDVVPSSGVIAETSSQHFGRAIPIAGIAGDQQAALFGQGCVEAGSAKCTYGTGAFLLMQIGTTLDDEPRRTGVLTTMSCGADGGPAYALEGSVFIAGAAIQWLRDGLGLLKTAPESEGLARSVESTDGVYFVPALVGLGAPHWQAEARGTIVGLTRGTQRAHLVRAALESMAFSTRDVVDAMVAASGVRLTELKVDGGASANDWLMQYQADLLGVRLLRPDMVETTALGAAGLAGLATGIWADVEAFTATRHYHSFENGTAREDDFEGWKRAVNAALHWAGS